jgi:hypothetical protein
MSLTHDVSGAKRVEGENGAYDGKTALAVRPKFAESWKCLCFNGLTATVYGGKVSQRARC